MQKGFRIFSVTLAVILAVYFSWAGYGRKRLPVDIHLHLDTTFDIHANTGNGSILGISPYMMPIDYASKQHFLNKLDGYMQAAALKGWLTQKTTVVFPEYIGTWLLIEGEKNTIYEAASIKKAMTTYIGSNFFMYLRDWFTAPDEAEDKLLHSLFSSKGVSMARIYQDVFGDLSKKYGVSIVGGSILLPNPVIENGRIRIRMGPLHNVSAVFNADGSIQPALVHKSFPTAEEKPFVAKAPSNQNPVFNLPSGKTSVLVCSDAWFPESYTSMKNHDPQLILVPSFTSGNNNMDQPWTGYSGFPMPEGASRSDSGRITLRDAWLKYTIPSRIKQTTAQYGMIVPLRGKLWDLGSDGEIIAVAGDSVYSSRKSQGAAMVNLWIGNPSH